MILVTGSAGLIGRHLITHLRRAGTPVRGFDIAEAPSEDTRDAEALAAALDGVEGVIHLAAVSRVVWAERKPALCQAINVDGLKNLLRLCPARPLPPWVIFASSREVYGDAVRLAVAEDVEFRPLNVYARSKVAGEIFVTHAAEAGLRAVISRFSSVFGCALDYADRVAMLRRSTTGVGTMAFDPGDPIGRAPAAHPLCNGRGNDLTGIGASRGAPRRRSDAIEYAPPRDYDVARFVGIPSARHSYWAGVQLSRCPTVLPA